MNLFCTLGALIISSYIAKAAVSQSSSGNKPGDAVVFEVDFSNDHDKSLDDHVFDLILEKTKSHKSQFKKDTFDRNIRTLGRKVFSDILVLAKQLNLEEAKGVARIIDIISPRMEALETVDLLVLKWLFARTQIYLAQSVHSFHLRSNLYPEGLALSAQKMNRKASTPKERIIIRNTLRLVSKGTNDSIKRYFNPQVLVEDAKALLEHNFERHEKAIREWKNGKAMVDAVYKMMSDDICCAVERLGNHVNYDTILKTFMALLKSRMVKNEYSGENIAKYLLLVCKSVSSYIQDMIRLHELSNKANSAPKNH
jgi:hypothetical protein